MHSFIHPFLSIYLSFHLSMQLSDHLSFHPFCLFVHLSIHLFIRPHIHPSWSCSICKCICHSMATRVRFKNSTGLIGYAMTTLIAPWPDPHLVKDVACLTTPQYSKMIYHRRVSLSEHPLKHACTSFKRMYRRFKQFYRIKTDLHELHITYTWVKNTFEIIPVTEATA